MTDPANVESIENEEETIVHEGVHNYSSEDEWVRPSDPVILERLEWFQDQKLGLMMHWGPYSQLGVVESWALSDGDADWARDCIDWGVAGEELKREYFDLNLTFNPIRFQPEVWADLAADSGFKYLTFTTKHHDGFCMWDTHTTDYRITGSQTPFHRHKYADICRNLFDAFRARGLAISTYFSKADWHTPDYWAPGMERGEKMWRGPSYDPKEYPWLWEKFVQFTHEQITELMTRYGRIDMLWLDAGWVNEHSGQDIRLGALVDQIRQEHQPWLLSADRTVGGAYENIITPEQTLPDRPLHVPWESCITIGTSFSFNYEDRYKTPRELVHLLVEIVAKGGNLALNIGPQPDGRLPKAAIDSMQGLGIWLKNNGEAIYGTRICAPYTSTSNDRKVHWTRKEEATYAIVLYKESENVEQELELALVDHVERAVLLGTEQELPLRRTDQGAIVTLPSFDQTDETPIALAIRLT